MATTPEPEQAIEVRDLVKRYPKSKTNAVDGVSFTVRRGEIFGLLGPNGAGKTTTIGVLTTTVVPTRGAAQIMGIDITRDLIGTLIKPERIGLMFALIFTPLLFTGCTYYPWSALGNIKWFQIVTLFNPLTYAAEGMRYAMVPAVHLFGHTITLATLDMRWVLLALSGTIVVFFILGTRTFHRRVVS